MEVNTKQSSTLVGKLVQQSESKIVAFYLNVEKVLNMYN